MAKEITSRCEHIKLIDGTEIPLTLNFKKLFYLRANGYEKAVNDAMKMLQKKGIDLLDMPCFLWVAYLCAVDKPAYTEDEFVGLLPWDIPEAMTLFNNLNTKKKG